MSPRRHSRRLDSLNWSSSSRVTAQRRPLAPRPQIADALALAAGVGLGVVMALVIAGETAGSLAGPGGWWTAAGRMFGFVGAYAMLVMVVLIARVPWLERAVGQDRLVRWHRTIGGWPLGLIGLHIVFVTIGYAATTRSGFWHQFWQFVTQYPDMLAALAGFVLLVMAGVSSIRQARRRVRYETWWVIHLYMYLGLTLAFFHQVVTGASFLHHPLTRFVWTAMWVATAALVLVCRVGLAFVRNVRHRLRVAAVVNEAPGVYSVICRGRHIDRLAVNGGQFFQWRFMSTGLWWHAHPYSISALPRAPYVRVTIKGLGDQSRAVAHLRVGTRVIVEGPYGTFTHHQARAPRVVLIAAGVGVTPVRSLLEDLAVSSDVTVIVRASRPDDVLHRDELVQLIARRDGRLVELVGSRDDVRMDASTLSEYFPDPDHVDVFICGPDGFVNNVLDITSQLGVPAAHIHRESFAF